MLGARVPQAAYNIGVAHRLGCDTCRGIQVQGSGQVVCVHHRRKAFHEQQGVPVSSRRGLLTSRWPYQR